MEEKQEKSLLVFSGFIIKILAFFFMTLDHVGALLQYSVGENYWLGITFRFLGRLALPLFCFMIAEGVVHSKRPGHYFLRLGIMGTFISLALYLIVGVINNHPDINGGLSFLRSQGNIFMDLLLGALAVYCLKQEKWYFKLLVIFPIAFAITSFIVTCLESAEPGLLIHWFPYFLRPQYHIYSVGMIICFYLVRYLSDLFIKQYSNNSGISFESVKGSIFERKVLNILSMGVVVTLTLLYFVTSLLIPSSWVYWMSGIQNAAIVSGAFLLLYNGKRGYNAKWFQYGSYLYYPLHILIIFGIALLI